MLALLLCLCANIRTASNLHHGGLASVELPKEARHNTNATNFRRIHRAYGLALPEIDIVMWNRSVYYFILKTSYSAKTVEVGVKVVGWLRSLQ